MQRRATNKAEAAEVRAPWPSLSKSGLWLMGNLCCNAGTGLRRVRRGREDELPDVTRSLGEEVMEGEDGKERYMKARREVTRSSVFLRRFFFSLPRRRVELCSWKGAEASRHQTWSCLIRELPSPIRMYLITKRNSRHEATLSKPMAIDEQLLWLLNLATPHLLGLEVLIQQEQGRFVRLGCAHDGEHALARLIMRGLKGVKSDCGYLETGQRLTYLGN